MFDLEKYGLLMNEISKDLIVAIKADDAHGILMTKCLLGVFIENGTAKQFGWDNHITGVFFLLNNMEDMLKMRNNGRH